MLVLRTGDFLARPPREKSFDIFGSGLCARAASTTLPFHFPTTSQTTAYHMLTIHYAIFLSVSLLLKSERGIFGCCIFACENKGKKLEPEIGTIFAHFKIIIVNLYKNNLTILYTLERVAFYDPTRRRKRYHSLTSFEAAFCINRAL